MATSLQSKKYFDVTEIAARRIKNHTGGLGELAARDFFNKTATPQIDLPVTNTVTKPAGKFVDHNAQRVARERAAMIASGQIKPVKGGETT